MALGMDGTVGIAGAVIESAEMVRMVAAISSKT